MSLLLPPIHIPDSTAGLAITAVQCLNLLAFNNEKLNPTGYSKFADKATSTLPSRRGMLMIYTPAFLVSAVMLARSPDVGRARLVASLLTAHFGKRVGEVLCVHKYSGSMPASSAYMIGTFYALLSLLISVQTGHVPPSLYEAAASQAALPVSLALFGIGQVGNLYHHYLLARMRDQPAPPGDASSYRIPSGGLFELVATPHYLFEIIAWSGVALASQQLNAVLVTLGMASYLCGRAVASTSWYKSKFGDKYPSKRRHIIPFIF